MAAEWKEGERVFISIDGFGEIVEAPLPIPLGYVAVLMDNERDRPGYLYSLYPLDTPQRVQ